MIQLFSVLIPLLGLLCGAALVAAPFGWLPGAQGPLLWLLFPVLTLVGYGMFAAAASEAASRAMSRAASGLLMALALAAMGALVALALGVAVVEGGTGAWWYVLALGLSLGGAGLLADRRPA